MSIELRIAKNTDRMMIPKTVTTPNRGLAYFTTDFPAELMPSTVKVVGIWFL
jgi:hypothetical protein